MVAAAVARWDLVMMKALVVSLRLAEVAARVRAAAAATPKVAATARAVRAAMVAATASAAVEPVGWARAEPPLAA